MTCLCALWLWVPFVVAAAAEQPVARYSEGQKLQLVASINPLALLARELLRDSSRVEVSLLLPPQASPHHYALKMSDSQLLYQADLVLWIGPELERFLAKLLVSQGERQLALTSLTTLKWPEEWNGGEGKHQHRRDPHIWLNPHNGIEITKALIQHLQTLDPEGAEEYQARGRILIERLHELDLTIQQQSRSYADQGFVVYHRGYDHWVTHYGLLQLDAVTLGDDRRPGAKHLYRIERSLAGRAKCLFVASSQGRGSAKALAERWSLTIGELDPMGVEADGYTNLLKSMSLAFSGCLLGK